MANAKNINKLIEAIKDEELARFDMGRWLNILDIHSGCGTVACIGGTASLLMGKGVDGMYPQAIKVMSWISLDVSDGNNLFYSYRSVPTTTTKADAIEALELIRDTGEWIGWDAFYAMKENA